MAHFLPNYLRTYRRRAGFTQAEMAYLLGCKSGARISLYERSGKHPNLKTVFAYEIIFGIPGKDLFAGFFHKTSVMTTKRAVYLIRKLNTDKADRKTMRKLETLNKINFRKRP